MPNRFVVTRRVQLLVLTLLLLEFVVNVKKLHLEVGERSGLVQRRPVQGVRRGHAAQDRSAAVPVESV